MRHWFSQRASVSSEYPMAWKAAKQVYKYQNGAALLSQKKRDAAVLKHCKKLPPVPGFWNQRRFIITISKELMEVEVERRALNQAMALYYVPFYLNSMRKRDKHADRYIVVCTWFIDGTFFMQQPVSEGERIICTNMLKGHYEPRTKKDRHSFAVKKGK